MLNVSSPKSHESALPPTFPAWFLVSLLDWIVPGPSSCPWGLICSLALKRSFTHSETWSLLFASTNGASGEEAEGRT